MAVVTDLREGHARRQRSHIWLCGWPKRTVPGVVGAFKGQWRTWGTTWRTPQSRNILKRRIEPAPERIRKTTWKEFLKQHWDQILATDFFTVEVWTASGLTRFVVLFFIDLSTRRVEIGGIACSANGLWMAQIARNVTDTIDGFSRGKRYLIHDRDPLYTTEFLSLLADSGIESIKLPPRSPNLNAYRGTVCSHN